MAARGGFQAKLSRSPKRCFEKFCAVRVGLNLQCWRSMEVHEVLGSVVIFYFIHWIAAAKCRNDSNRC
ncbi:MAG: hypothetical protein MK137_10035, partial [Rickettsiales bacterium]|nr:hypothetical protein [Rickettsiales bacterium]